MQTQWIIKLLTSAFVASILLSSCTKNDEVISYENNNPIPPSNLAERIIIDTAYGSADKQKMDLYLPAGRNKATKVVVMIHGGAWFGGDKNELTAYLHLLKTKWPDAAFVNINYRLANGTAITYTQMMEDVQAALSFVAIHKDYFNISDTIALWGASAGAHLAMQYTYTKNDEGLVRCVVNMYGPSKINDWNWYLTTVPLSVKESLRKLSGSVWNEQLYKKLSPIETVTGNAKPTIIFHGNIDPVVPVYQSQWLHNRLKELGVATEYYEYTDFHGFVFDANTTDCITKTIAFLKNYTK